MPARPELVNAVIQQETGGRANPPDAGAGAVGLMQIEPETAKAYGFDPSRLRDPAYNRMAGTTILGSLVDQHNGNEREGLKSYYGRGDPGPGFPTSDEYADSVLKIAGPSGGSPSGIAANYADRASHGANGPASVDQQYAARQADNQDVANGRTLLAEHPELLRLIHPETAQPVTANAELAPPMTPARPPAGVPTAQQEALQSSDIVAEAASSIAKRVYPNSPIDPDTIGKIASLGTQVATLPLGIGKAGEAVDATEEAGTAVKAAKGAEATTEGVTEFPKGTILDTQGNPIKSAATPASPPPATAEGTGAVAGSAATPASAAPAPVIPPEHATPAAAASTLAQKQLDNLKAVRVGEQTATEFGKPEIATTVPESLTMDESKSLRQDLESYYAQGAEKPQLAAHVQALASTYHEENKGIHSFNEDLWARAAKGEDVSTGLQQLGNRFAAFAENYSVLAGTRSDVGRSLQILDPNKPGNAFVAATAKIAQQLGEGDNAQRLSDLLHQLGGPDKFARVARQMSEDVGLGRSLYNAFNEYYFNNLLSNAGRTSSRIATSSTVSGLMTLPTRLIQGMMPGSGVKLGEPLAGIQGIVNGFWHSADIGLESGKTGKRLSQMEGGSIEADNPFGYGAHRAISGQAFGLGAYNPDTADWESSGIGKGVDYLGNVLRLGGNVLTGVHQFVHSAGTSMAGHMLAWRDAVDQAAAEGLDGIKGYNRATELYHGTINDMPAEMRLNASKEADSMTFVNQLEQGTFAKSVSDVFQYPVLKQLMPFFRIAYNVKKMGLDYTPGLGALTQASDIAYGTAQQRSAALAKQAFGAMMSVAIAHEFHQGNLVLDKYGSPKARFGDSLVALPPPLDTPFGIIGNYLQNRDAMSDPDALDKAGAAARAIGNSMANDSIVQGLVNIKKLWTDIADGEPKALKQFVGSEASGLVPWSALLRGVAMGTDTLARNPQTVAQELETGIPGIHKLDPLTEAGLPFSPTAGLAQNVQPKVDIFNKPAPNPTMGLPARLLYPVNVTKVSHDNVVNELARLNVNAQHPPQFLDKFPGATEKWNADRADGLREDLESYINDKDYPTDPDQLKKVTIENILARASHIANVGMLDDPKIADMVENHKEALRGLSPDAIQALSGSPPVANEFGVAGPSNAIVPRLQ